MNQPSAHQIEQALIRDRFRLRRLWRSIQRARRDNKPHDKLLRTFERELDASLRQVSRRRESAPHVGLDQDLPILAHREAILDAVDSHQVVVVCGETGSGKSTQLPQFCLQAGYGITGMIGHTQPRRIAARSVAARLAEELRQPLGQDVGFKIRFTDKTSLRTYIKLMTDGILLAETQGDRYLEQYEVIILDEAHERSLNIDFLLGYLKRLLPRRPELRVIVTSATIDAERFAAHFADRQGPAPIIEVSGRSFPVEVRYRPLAADVDDQTEADPLHGIVQAVHELAEIDTGHILIFLPTERDIRETAKRLRAESLPRDGNRRTEILPLYARLSAAEQNRVFHAVSHRRIVLATNVAESSLTVPGIRYVIDTGTARISRYSPRSKVQRLPIEAVSRASADQRKGRCGRIAPGVCIRLYAEDDFATRAAFTTPEIQRTNLASVILQAKALKLGRVEEFPFLDPPRPEAIRDGYKTLFEIGAVDQQEQLTEMGLILARLPVDPRIARIIVAADEGNCLSEILIIAAALEVQDPRERPHDKRQAADQQHEKFADGESDFVSYLKMWDFYHELKEKLSRNQLRKACQQNFLSYNRLREWSEIERQLLKLVTSNGFRVRARRDNYDAIHRALLTGFLWGVAFRSGDHEYSGAGGIKFHLWPGSGLFQSKPKWCVAAELIETTRRYGRTVARINPNWIEPLAEHLVKRHYSDPHWHQKSGRVMAFERVSLFGLTVVARRRVPYGQIDAETAREIFIREALAARQLDIRDKFYTHNEAVIAQAGKIAAKSRRSEYLVDDYQLVRFYEDRIPAQVVDLASLRQWLKQREPNEPDLFMKIDDLMEGEHAEVDERQFPDDWQAGGMTLPIEYQFAPGEDNDGVTVTVPVAGVGQIQPRQADWLVPGLLEDKIVALIRSLPKSIRRNLIPAPDTARRVAAELEFGQGDFLTRVVERLSTIAEEPIPLDAFRLEKIPRHLQLNLRVIDDEGKTKCQSRAISELQAKLGSAATAEVATVEDSHWQRDGIRTWDFGELPAQITIQRGGIDVPAFPALLDQGESVALRLLGSRAQANGNTRRGIRRLYVLNQKRALRSQVSWLPRWEEICLFATSLLDKAALKQQVAELIADRAFLGEREPLPRDEAAFHDRLTNSAERIGLATQDVAKMLPRLFEAYHQARLALEQPLPMEGQYAVEDTQNQLSMLVSGNFLADTPWQWLREYPRYCQAIVYRLDRLGSGSLSRDREATNEIAEFRRRYEQRRAADGGPLQTDSEVELYRWMIEEYRVSVFAQPLGTLFSISAKRLEKQWGKVN